MKEEVSHQGIGWKQVRDCQEKKKKSSETEEVFRLEKNNYLRDFLGDGVLVSSIFEYCFDNNVKRNPDDEI